MQLIESYSRTGPDQRMRIITSCDVTLTRPIMRDIFLLRVKSYRVILHKLCMTNVKFIWKIQAPTTTRTLFRTDRQYIFLTTDKFFP